MNETSGHDPLCLFKEWTPQEPWAERKCQCDLIARVRADEVRRMENRGLVSITAIDDLRAKVFGLLVDAKWDRDAMPKADMRDDPFAYGNAMWYCGRVTGVVEALALLKEES